MRNWLIGACIEFCNLTTNLAIGPILIDYPAKGNLFKLLPCRGLGSGLQHRISLRDSIEYFNEPKLDIDK